MGSIPAGHEVALVTTKTFPLTRSVVQRLPLGELAGALEHAPQVATLYIPPVDERPVADESLLEVMLAGESA